LLEGAYRRGRVQLHWRRAGFRTGQRQRAVRSDGDHPSALGQRPVNYQPVAGLAPAWLGERWGNASSSHRFGQAASAAVEEARAAVAALLGAAPSEIVFTASGTEANNAVVVSALRGLAAGERIVASAIEHPSVRVALEAAVERGVEMIWIEPGADGVVPAEAFIDALGANVRLAALMLANNELGTVQPVAAVAAAARAAGAPFLCDAVHVLCSDCRPQCPTCGRASCAACRDGACRCPRRPQRGDGSGEGPGGGKSIDS